MLSSGREFVADWRPTTQTVAILANSITPIKARLIKEYWHIWVVQFIEESKPLISL